MNVNHDNITITLLGEEGVGKTSIVSQFINHIYLDNRDSSISGQYYSKNLILENKTQIRLNIWDTSGQPRYRSLAKIFFKDSDAIIVVYDITQQKSFNELKNYWVEYVKDYYDKDKELVLAIVANKYDSTGGEVDEEVALQLAEDINAIFSHVSAKRGIGIDDLFYKIAKKVIKKRKREL